jgi:hypothetical protein
MQPDMLLTQGFGVQPVGAEPLLELDDEVLVELDPELDELAPPAPPVPLDEVDPELDVLAPPAPPVPLDEVDPELDDEVLAPPAPPVPLDELVDPELDDDALAPPVAPVPLDELEVPELCAEPLDPQPAATAARVSPPNQTELLRSARNAMTTLLARLCSGPLPELAATDDDQAGRGAPPSSSSRHVTSIRGQAPPTRMPFVTPRGRIMKRARVRS